MANEITASCALTFSKSPATAATLSSLNRNFNASGSKYVRNVQTIGFGAVEALDLGDVGTPGWFYIKNLDATNYVEIYTALAGVALLKLKAGEFAVGRFTVAAPCARANVADCLVEYLIAED